MSRCQVIEFRDLSLDEKINIILKYKRDLDVEYIKNLLLFSNKNLSYILDLNKVEKSRRLYSKVYWFLYYS